ncbi:3-oxoacyl-[acyl-carrier-protein] reductase [Frisingicoccus caecimuris]|uniref:3-oxoacyl-[acyl-carrier-protein] reductase n=1 Tax=Frisingicoccus caecimuris TaxID=1796636 RepID=A0A4R2L910_9FIRM|nr:3-oxoacyl-[acyl-carrier-protein] reductase [Frisingicoccus caecimuris]MCR1919705.1 3-oxoacyl-[acyl-carrier-protein] reductase [Frisingicoccus caecimuris]TCO83218.1 3-oxoacyl-[acyl-carrier-protein] reductase [Frisingicoccus caecimuris]
MLKNKIALITGGGRGIGAGIAREMAAQGAVVIINYSHSEEAAKQVQSEIRAAGGKAEVFCCDVSDYNSVKAMTGDIIQHYGRLDILVNNAGIVKDGLLMRMKETDFDKVIDINLKGTFNCIQNVSRQMLKQRYGRIINMSSVVGIYGNAGQANYAASKAGIIGLTKSAAKELGRRGITVNAIAPGFIQTDMTETLSEALKEKILSAIALESFGTVQDIAHAACFLASDRAKYITGQVLGVDGGISM